MLVGATVPSATGEGEEKLRDEDDARSWQEAIKQMLVAEVKSRASKTMEENGDFLSLIHGSIELFQNNADLVPGTKEFDVELANRFTSLAAPYEVRVDDKLQGYSIPVQPIIDSLRATLVTERAGKAGGSDGKTDPAAAPAAPAPPSPPADPPQAGIPSKAGAGADGGEEFSTLFGTIGLPDFKI